MSCGNVWQLWTQNEGFVASAQKKLKKYEEVVVFDSLTNVRQGDTISSHSIKEEIVMTAVNSMNSSAFSCSNAAAVSSALQAILVDTAPVLAVSICIFSLLEIHRAGK